MRLDLSAGVETIDLPDDPSLALPDQEELASAGLLFDDWNVAEVALHEDDSRTFGDANEFPCIFRLPEELLAIFSKGIFDAPPPKITVLLKTHSLG
jgi:hypothetical protein